MENIDSVSKLLNKATNTSTRKMLGALEHEHRMYLDPSDPNSDFYVSLPITSTETVYDPVTGKNVNDIVGEKEALIKNATAKTTLVDADTLPLTDSAASKATKIITFANVKKALKTYFDTLYNKVTKTSELTNDSGYITSTSDISGTSAKAAALTREGEDGKKLEGLSGKNLLDNWYFGSKDFIINQQVQDVYTGAGYTIDRWKLSTNGKLTLTDNGLDWENTSSSEGIWAEMLQYIEHPEVYVGLTLTLSIDINGIIYSKTGVIDNLIDSLIALELPSNSSVPMRVDLRGLSNRLLFRIGGNSGASISGIRRAKLELGSISTLTSDPPQNYGVELAKCLRYQIVIPAYMKWRATYINPNYIEFLIPTPTAMRIAPSIIGNFAVGAYPATTIQTDFTFAISVLSSGSLLVRASKTAHGLTDAVLQILTGNQVIIDANL